MQFLYCTLAATVKSRMSIFLKALMASRLKQDMVYDENVRLRLFKSKRVDMRYCSITITFKVREPCALHIVQLLKTFLLSYSRRFGIMERHARGEGKLLLIYITVFANITQLLACKTLQSVVCKIFFANWKGLRIPEWLKLGMKGKSNLTFSINTCNMYVLPQCLVIFQLALNWLIMSSTQLDYVKLMSQSSYVQDIITHGHIHSFSHAIPVSERDT